MNDPWKNNILLLLLISILFSSVMVEISSSSTYWPTDDWKTHKPERELMDSDILDEMINYVENWNEEHSFSHVDSMLVIRNGFLVSEWYYMLWDADDKHVQWSVTKSFISTLIGIAIEKGFIPSVNEFVLDYFADRNISNVDARKEAMTIKHLLLMSTGMDYPGDDIIFSSWMNSPNQVQYILNLPMATEPGTIFNYDTGGSHLLSAILTNATGMATEDFAKEYLFDPLGIDDFTWLKDKQGINFGGHGLFLTPRDMVKLGVLYLNNGTWDGMQIVPKAWIQNITSTHWTFSSYWGYGQQWWTHPYLQGFSARGKDGQAIIVLPEQEIILVFTASISSGDSEPYFTIIDGYILPSLLERNPYLYTIIFVPSTFGLASIIGIVIWLNIKKKKSLHY